MNAGIEERLPAMIRDTLVWDNQACMPLRTDPEFLLRIYSGQELRSCLEAAGFSAVRIQGALSRQANECLPHRRAAHSQLGRQLSVPNLCAWGHRSSLNALQHIEIHLVSEGCPSDGRHIVILRIENGKSNIRYAHHLGK